MNNRMFRIGLGAALGALVLGVIGILALGGNDDAEARKTLEVEVVEIGSRFVFDETPVHADDGLPDYGGEFVTQGYIYPAGTIEEGHDGINADGSPEYPDAVIGQWTCRGWHVGDGAHSSGEPWVVTTQIFAFDGPTDGDQKGTKTIVTDGYELPDFGVYVTRAITGGTGDYRRAEGEQYQELMDFNETNGVILKVELNIF